MVQRAGRIFAKKGEGDTLNDTGQRQFNVDDQAIELRTITDQRFESGGIRGSRQGELKIAGSTFFCQTLRSAPANNGIIKGKGRGRKGEK